MPGSSPRASAATSASASRSFGRTPGSAASSALLVLLLACDRRAATDLVGRPVDPLATAAPATVLLFVDPSCPISNRYVPEILRLAERFSQRGARFFWVYPNASAGADAIRAHARAYGLGGEILRDTAHALVRRSGAEVTPEAALFDAHGALVYRGRIDDRHVDFGRSRPEPTRRDLELALGELLDGRRVTVARSTAVGCAIPPLE